MNRIPASVWRNPLHFIAFGFGSGVSPIMPGTVGTLFAIPFYLLLRQFSWVGYSIAVLIITVIVMWLADYVSKAINVHDHPGMNSDEFPGFFVTMLGVPLSWQAIVIGFILFRVFDILKPFPIGWIDKNMHNGVGIVLDDIVAGVFACIVLHFLLTALPIH